MRSEAEVAELEAFLASKKGVKFNFLNECLKYCMQDSIILFIAVLYLEKECLLASDFKISFINSSTFTLAGLAATFYRGLFMAKDSIGQIPVSGYLNDRQSLMAREYLAFLNSKLASYGSETIRYCDNNVAGESRWNKYHVDGATSYCLLEILGCFFHANPCCFGENSRKIHPLYKISVAQVQYLDKARQARYASLIYALKT